MQHELFWIIAVAVFFLFGTADVIAYRKAKYPERCKWYYTYIIGGGIVALLKYGKTHNVGVKGQANRVAV